jgi:hypothetical protein
MQIVICIAPFAAVEAAHAAALVAARVATRVAARVAAGTGKAGGARAAAEEEETLCGLMKGADGQRGLGGEGGDGGKQYEGRHALRTLGYLLLTRRDELQHIFEELPLCALLQGQGQGQAMSMAKGVGSGSDSDVDRAVDSTVDTASAPLMQQLLDALNEGIARHHRKEHGGARRAISLEGQLARLGRTLEHEVADVRQAALQQLCTLLADASHATQLTEMVLATESAAPPLVQRLVYTLLRMARSEAEHNRRIKSLCATALGSIGAIDPARMASIDADDGWAVPAEDAQKQGEAGGSGGSRQQRTQRQRYQELEEADMAMAVMVQV